MKILLINKFHYLRGGGAVRAYLDTARILVSRGHEVAFFSMDHPENEPTEWSRFFVSQSEYLDESSLSFFTKAKLAFRIIWNREAQRKLNALIDEFRPDVAHLHTIYHQLSPSIIWTLRKRRVPMVMTLHDYKLVSPNYSLFVRGKIWEHTSAWRCIVDRCVKNSFLKSLDCALEQWIHGFLGSYRKIDRFIAPSQFLINTYHRLGFAPDIMKISQPLLPFPEGAVPDSVGDYLLFFGRLSHEKGVGTLLRAVALLGGAEKVVIVGDGPEKNRLEVLAREILSMGSYFFPGSKYGAELETIRQKAKAIIIPSEWYENMPYVLLESLASGVPVIASRIGGMTERIKDGKNGLLFTPGDEYDLAGKIRSLPSFDAGTHGREARSSIEDLRPERYADALEAVYSDIVGGRDRGSEGS